MKLEDKDRGSEPQRVKKDYPWLWCDEEPGTGPLGGKGLGGSWWSEVHLTIARERGSHG